MLSRFPECHHVSSYVSTIIIDVIIPHGAIFRAEAHSDDIQLHSDGEYLHVPTVGGQCLLLCNYIFSNNFCIVKKYQKGVKQLHTHTHTHTHTHAHTHTYSQNQLPYTSFAHAH